ncbi:hypothetical protein [Planococcus versutus]|uniref:Uncharacterized protein n=1 Tax=Planococcus versutus TaxID=1302659 RepID=A0A1B1S5V4_9BACL|nr:hypothetical protein [Planococcus versutus]ANU28563.1 hypothetical protein I858_016405 [Planococcus versutus]
MRKLLLFLYVISLVVVLIGFYGMNFFTETVVEDGTGGGNGNPALFIPVFLMPFFFYFLYGTTELSMRLAEKIKTNKTLVTSLIFSVIAAAIIIIYTENKAQDLRKTIVQKQVNFETVSQVPLWSTFSNAIFFNALTFILVLLICYIIGAVWSIYRERRKRVFPSK